MACSWARPASRKRLGLSPWANGPSRRATTCSCVELQDFLEDFQRAQSRSQPGPSTPDGSGPDPAHHRRVRAVVRRANGGSGPVRAHTGPPRAGQHHPNRQQTIFRVGEVLGAVVIATAVLDRLIHHSYVVNIRGESYRLREKKRAGRVLHCGLLVLGRINWKLAPLVQN